MPYIEQNQIFKQWDIRMRYYVQPATAGRQIPAYLCPTRSAGLRNMSGQSRVFGGVNYTGPGGYSDYAACQGTTDHTVPLQADQFNGAFRRVWEKLQTCGGVQQVTGRWGNACQTAAFDTFDDWSYMANFRFFTDGLANTLLIGEAHVPVFLQSNGPVWNGDFQSQYRRYAGHTGVQDPITGLCTTEYRIVPLQDYNNPVDWNLRFGSAHSGICQFSFVDEHTKAISNSIDFEIYHRLSLRIDHLPVVDY